MTGATFALATGLKISANSQCDPPTYILMKEIVCPTKRRYAPSSLDMQHGHDLQQKKDRHVVCLLAESHMINFVDMDVPNGGFIEL